ncbi:MAG: NAD(P)H-hydrate epimerase, partial [Myxococcota bacterium]
MKLASARTMRALDARTIREAGTPGHVLMERAGRGAAGAWLEAFPVLAGKSVAVFCGKGNNGGDGLVIAAALCNAG